MEFGNPILGRKGINFRVGSILSHTKLFEFPVEIDFPKESAFNDVQYPAPFQKFLRIRFFDAEVRFFGTAIINKNEEITH